MASRKFRFVSPGVFLREIDNSQLPKTPEGIGPVIIGRTRKGPAMKPYKVRSMEEFERIFGKPMPGNQGEDPWREGTGLLAESYLPYAAKAYLSADIDSPATIIRLAGIAGDDATTAGEPGWEAGNAWGIFLMPEDTAQTSATLELAAIFYGSSSANFGIKMKGAPTDTTLGDTVTTSSVAVDPSNGKFTVQLSSSAGTRDVTFAFEDIRKDFNTNPVMTNEEISSVVSGTLSHHYWLGETFEETYHNVASMSGSTKVRAIALKLADEMEDFKGTKHGLKTARSGWVFGNDTSGERASYNPDNQQRLFRVLALHDGLDASRDLVISIEDIKLARSGAKNRFGSFSVVVKQITPARLVEIERFDGCNLDPTSANYIARRIGDVYMEWDPIQKRNKVYGSNPNVSEFIRIEMNQEIEAQGGPISQEQVPFGFYGPIAPDAATSKKATATIVVTDATTINTAETFSLINGSNVTTSYRLSTGGSWDNRSGGNVGNQIDVFIGSAGSGATGKLRVASAIAAAINATSGSLMAASSDGVDTVTVTQLIPGTAGNKTSSENVTGLTVSNFTGGSGNIPAWLKSAPINTVGATTSTADVKIKWPSIPIVTTGSKADGIGGGFMFGATPFKQSYVTGSGTPLRTINKGYVDFTRVLPDIGSSKFVTAQETGLAGTDCSVSFKFSLDDVKIVPSSGVAMTSVSGIGQVKDAIYLSGSRKAGTSWSAKTTGSLQLRTLLDIVDGFHMPLIGGNDGVDITEADPFNMRVIDADATSATNYAYASVDRAIEMIKDPEMIEHNLAAMPGITNTSLTTKLVRTCEARADSLAVIDLPDVYIPPFQEKCTSFKDRTDNTTPETSAKNLVARQINSSYGATYYPWVKVKDEQFNRDVWVPPSVVALGVMAYTEERDDVWFAPAGFNRGGLNTGNAGLPVLQASEQLLSKDRDTLYAANINPVAQFVSEGLVIFGQKTLQADQSALDRINVRRLLIFVKKEVSRISNGLLFEQNVQATWSRFTNQVVPFLKRVKTRFGLSDFKVVLDDTTTTPDLIDRNIMYAKVYLKPARSIEFIAVDFVITNTGASFDD